MLKPLMGKGLAIGDADLHRLVREMVKAEVAGEQALDFCKSIANLMFKDFDKVVSTRAVFVLIELIESDKTKDLVIKQCRQHKPTIEQRAKAEKSAGLQILLKKL